MDIVLIYGTGPFYVTCAFAFVVGACIGSFLNVVIWRVPQGESIVTAPSHCPACGHGIRWYENVPIFGWIWLRGKCSRCHVRISVRYPVVESLTALLFLAAWVYGWQEAKPPAMIFAWLVIISLLIAITYIDLDHMIIPDGLNLTGIVAAFGFALVWPASHDIVGAPYHLMSLRHRPMLYVFAEVIVRWWDGFLASARAVALLDLMLGMALGGGSLWLLVEVGKLLFGRRRMRTREPVLMTMNHQGFETEEHDFELWEDVFMRDRDRLRIKGQIVGLELLKKREAPFQEILTGGHEVAIVVDEEAVQIGEERLPLADMATLTIRTREWVEPREVMGFGDVKLMAMLGAFLGPGAALFILAVSSLVGTVGGLLLMLFSGVKLYSKIPYGPYIAAAALIYIFFGNAVFDWYARLLQAFMQM